MGSIAVEVCRPGELGPTEVDRWRELLRPWPELHSAFVVPEFARAVDDVRSGARVAVVWEGNQLAGFFPFLHARFGAGLPISGSLGTSQVFVHRPGLTWSWREIADGAGLRALDLRYLVGSQATGGAFRTALSPVVDTSGGYDAYVGALRGRKFLKTVLYKERRLGREVGPVEVRFGEPDAAGVGSLIRWKSEQYRRTGRPDPFAHRWVRELLDRLQAEDTIWLVPVFSALRAGGTLVAADLSLRSLDVVSCWFGAYDPAFAAYSPGAVRTLRMIEAACSAGVGRLELSAGDEAYKGEWKTGDGLVADGYVVVPGPTAALRRAARSGAVAARRQVLASPRLRGAVRSSLRSAGAVRTALRPRARWAR